MTALSASVGLNGSFTPLVTPFRGDEVDYETFRQLIRLQVDGGSAGVVVTGTTGEPSLLTVEERIELYTLAVSVSAGELAVIAATGSQSLLETLQLTRAATEAGVDAVLVVTPYYVRPTQPGIVEFFSAVAEVTDLPFLIYHIPGRAAVSVDIATLAQIGERVGTLAGIKHASQDLALVSDCIRHFGPGFSVLVGLEELALPMLALGASGLVNAVGNLLPADVAEMCSAMEDKDLGRARELHMRLLDLNRAVFWEPNPTPMKYLMWRAGLLPEDRHRLPMLPPSEAVARRLDKVWDSYRSMSSVQG